LPFFGSFLWQDKKEQKGKNRVVPLGLSGKPTNYLALTGLKKSLQTLHSMGLHPSLTYAALTGLFVSISGKKYISSLMDRSQPVPTHEILLA
jgi:hypothetical protein